ncbi:MAG: hypothetical protein IKK20_03760 [Clostridia bacterium]|nr:hypothetical protein [Clostridia bacterium]
MRRKRGFVLVYSLAIMVVVFALTSILVAVMSAQNTQTKRTVANFQNRVAVCQIANDFVGLQVDEFCEKYEELGFAKTMQINQIMLEKTDFEFSIFLSTNGANSALKVVQNQKNLIVATVEKSNGATIVWSYEERENQ